MKKPGFLLAVLCVISITTLDLSGQKTVRPKEIDDILINPGIGFMTFGRFNGDDKGADLKEGKQSELPKFSGKLENKNHPGTSIAYFRFYWINMEPEMGKYNWPMIDLALKIAHERNQTLMLRIMPYAGGDIDVPKWYRAMTGEKDYLRPKWRVDPEDPRYAMYFCKMITEFGKRYDGHPDLESVDVSIVGFWGEGDGSVLLSQKTRETLVNAYIDNFKKTPLIMLLTDEKTNKYGLSRANVGWRVDCIGDLGLWGKGFNHMYDYYPEGIINFGMKDAWKKAPVSAEICGIFENWRTGSLESTKSKPDTCKYCGGYSIKDVDYIIDETLKWHLSSFNAKSSAVPDIWKPQIDRWLKKMGYRFVLRSFTFQESVSPNEKLSFKSWWDNKGVAPCYKKFLLAIRLKNNRRTDVLITDADITTWFPGDNLYDDSIFVPPDTPSGEYTLQIGIVDSQSHEPKVNLAIEGRDSEGWYTVGKITVN
jgi:hypothetical protein